MPKTAYCQDEPVKSALDAERDAFTLEEEVEVEKFLQRWGRGSIDPAHVYADDGLRYQVLARRLTVSPRLMVAFHDKDAPKTTVTAARGGRPSIPPTGSPA